MCFVINRNKKSPNYSQLFPDPINKLSLIRKAGIAKISVLLDSSEIRILRDTLATLIFINSPETKGMYFYSCPSSTG